MKTLRGFAGALAVLLVAGALTLLGSVSPVAASEGTGITGRVTDADTGAPVAGIVVTPFCELEDPEGSGNYYWGECASDPAGTAITTTTAGDGTYELPMGPGTYRVGFKDPDGAFVSEYYDDADRVHEAADVIVADALPATSIDAALSPATAISGTVADESGAPLANIGVSLHEARTSSSGSITWVVARVATTDANGRYTVDGLVRGDVYRIGFSDYSGTFVGEFHDDVRTLSLAADVTAGESGPIDAVLARDLGESITGMITDVAGNPVSGVSVNAVRTDIWEPAGSATSGEDGTYAISGLDPGQHRLNFTLNDPYLYAYNLSQDVRVVQSAGAVADLSVHVGGQISGTVRNAAGQPIANATVYARSSGGGEGDGKTDADGRYVIGGVALGDAEVSFSADGYRSEWYHDHWDWSSDVDTVSVKARETTIVDEVLSAEVSASGRITFSDGTPLDSEYVILERQSDSGWEHAATYWTDADGGYTTGMLDPGTYRIKVRSPDDGAPSYSEEFVVSEGAQEVVRDVHLDWSPVAITNTEAPALIGTGTVGEEVMVHTGNWTDNAYLEIQWLRDGQPISGGSGEAGELYRVQQSDAGHEISARVTAIKYGYIDGVATTEPLTVTYGQLTNSQALAVTGTPKVGETLGVDPGAWSTDGVTFDYRWLRDGATIDGATGATYELSPDDYGHAISVQVTASKDTWASGTAVSSSVDVQRGDLVLAPSITGDIRIGKTLTASVTAPEGADVRYSWQVRSPAAGSSSDTFKEVGTASSFALADRYKNYALRLVVTVSATGYNDAAATVDISEQLR